MLRLERDIIRVKLLYRELLKKMLKVLNLVKDSYQVAKEVGLWVLVVKLEEQKMSGT